MTQSASLSLRPCDSRIPGLDAMQLLLIEDDTTISRELVLRWRARGSLDDPASSTC
jgi:hypothetical protein